MRVYSSIRNISDTAVLNVILSLIFLNFISVFGVVCVPVFTVWTM